MVKKSQPTMYRFYRSNLATIVWDKENQKALAEFVGGQFYTEDEEVANKLIEIGYPRISLNATEPPDVLFQKGEIIEGNVPMLPPGMTEQAMLAKQKQQALAKKANTITEVEDPMFDMSSQSPSQITMEQKKSEQKSGVKNSSSKRRIKRRK